MDSLARRITVDGEAAQEIQYQARGDSHPQGDDFPCEDVSDPQTCRSRCSGTKLTGCSSEDALQCRNRAGADTFDKNESEQLEPDYDLHPDWNRLALKQSGFESVLADCSNGSLIELERGFTVFIVRQTSRGGLDDVHVSHLSVRLNDKTNGAISAYLSLAGLLRKFRLHGMDGLGRLDSITEVVDSVGIGIGEWRWFLV